MPVARSTRYDERPHALDAEGHDDLPRLGRSLGDRMRGGAEEADPLGLAVASLTGNWIDRAICDPGALSISTGRVTGRLIVQIVDVDGNPAQCGFSFVTYNGTRPSCGVGFELVGLLPGIAWIRRRVSGKQRSVADAA